MGVDRCIPQLRQILEYAHMVEVPVRQNNSGRARALAEAFRGGSRDEPHGAEHAGVD